MSNYTTIVIRTPADEAGKQQIRKALDLLKPYQTGMSLEDEMTVLELIEEHEDFDSSIADEARERASALHARAVAN